jgi:Predicted oxidoreductases of the aldo/keto reductase family
MEKIILGRTGISSNKNGFGALPIQRVSASYAGMLMRKAYDAGITFFDTARSYSDSEEKIGLSMSDIRDKITLATKTPAQTGEDFWKDLETSLRLLKTDYIDIFQFHNPAFCPRPGEENGLYDAMLKAKEQGKIRFIGITNHRMDVAEEAVKSGLYDTLQFPFCYLATQRDIDLVELCAEKNVGFIGMKALSGGILDDSAAAYAWLARYKNVLPIWGIQKESELDDFIHYIDNPPVLNAELSARIEKDKAELSGNFCRACGYCMPCPVGIQINMAARMSPLIRRSPAESWLNENGQNMMMKIKDCIECGQCKSKCPYGLDTPVLLKENLRDYEDILSGKVSVTNPN